MNNLKILPRKDNIRGLGGSDATRIMKGDGQKLWEEITGRREREDLSDILRVQMGTFTEPFNIEWYQKQTGNSILSNHESYLSRLLSREAIKGEFGVQITHAVHPWMVASPDAIIVDEVNPMLLECKHTNEWAFKAPQRLKETYYAQLQHNMEVCGLRVAHLSFFGGNGLWDYLEVEYDMEYVMKLIEIEEDFWRHILDDTPPVPVEIEVNPMEGAIRKRIQIDMSAGNRASEWREQAEIWADKKADAKKFNDAAKKLKDMMPDEADEAFGHGIVIKKSKSGARTISIPKF